MVQALQIRFLQWFSLGFFPMKEVVISPKSILCRFLLDHHFWKIK